MKELLDKFSNGQELYDTNAVFNKIVHFIAFQDMSLYQAISIFAEQNEKQQTFIKELIERSPIQPVIFKDKYN